MNRLTVTENMTRKGMLVIVYDEQDHNIGELTEIDLNTLYFSGVLTARFGSYAFKQQVKNFIRGN